MGVDKVGTKGGGFFHLFDWNRKSRKKLFANGTASPEGTKQERKSYNNLPVTRLRLVGDDGAGAVSSVKDNSDYSCASSVTDEDGNGIRAPGVVARLMGLETMPSAGTTDLYSSPLFQPQPLHEGRYRKCSNPQPEINSQFIGMHNEIAAYSKKPQEPMKIQRMPSSPIERFQTEVLPPRSARSVPLTNHKLLSPIKNPRFISTKDASYIMEAAAKIIEPGNPNASARTPSGGSFSHSLRVRDPKECASSSSQRTPKLPDSFKRPAESNAMKYLRGKPLSKSWNGSETDFSNCQASLDREEVTSISAKSKGKSISLAIQAKVNVQKREGRASVAQKEQEEFKSAQSLRSQPGNQKDRLQRKVSGPTASGVLKQNNQKQNCWSNKDKLSAIPSVSHSQGRKAFSREASSSSRTKTTNKPHGNSNSGCRRKGSQIINVEKEASSSTVNLSRNKRTKVDHASEKTGCVDDALASRPEKHVQHCVIIDEQTKQCEDRRKNGMDVVSFTFTSSLVHDHGSQSINVREKQETWKDYYPQAPREGNPPTEASNKKLSSCGLDIPDGDALSVLLEQKLRELRFGMESSQTNFQKDNNVAITSMSQDAYCASENSSAVTMENEKEVSWETCTDNDSATCDSGLSTKNVRVSSVRYNLQETDVLAEFSSNYDALKEPDHERLSPFSILEPSFSYESCNSSESCDSGNGSTAPSAILAQDTTCFVSKKISPAVEAEMEVSDYASCSLKEITWQRQMVSRNNHIRSQEEKEYVKEILSAANLNSKNFAVQCISKSLNPLLFEQIELKKYRFMRCEEDQDGRVRRKVLFDCVRESLDLKIQRYFSAGYITWRKGLAVVGCGELAEEIYKEISVWSRMGDWMVDELVDKDMSNPMGNWLDFEPDSFLIGIVIENKILGTLINEVVAELLKV